jgi:hypothetical protein
MPTGTGKRPKENGRSILNMAWPKPAILPYRITGIKLILRI